jgi:hypothetical protein
LRRSPPHLPEPLLGRAVQAIGTLESGYQQAKALEALAPYLPDSLLDSALNALQLEEVLGEAEALHFLVPHSYDLVKRELTLMEHYGRREGLALLRSRMPAGVLMKALMAVRRLGSRSHLIALVAELCAFFPEDTADNDHPTLVGEANLTSLIEETLDLTLFAAETIGDSRSRAR